MVRAMAAEKMQEQEWKIAQDINVSLDLVSATKQHLKFLAAVDRNSSWLCEDGPALQRAIYRYKTCWIPLLAKHMETPLSEGPLVVPLDCEWIWHCHRLNPTTYKWDCEKAYNMVLDNKNVVSSTQETSEKETEVVWKNLYPNEPYLLDPSVVVNGNNGDKVTEAWKFTEYDLTFSVQRQSLFFSQVSEPYMSNDLYLEGAVARYKGFLHIIKRNMERNSDDFLAPTYDIDLIWHTHQLYPVPYGNDLQNLMGMVLGHDDTVVERTPGQMLDVGFTTSISSWADVFGTRYKRAGALHKFSKPEKKITSSDTGNKDMHLPELKIMEVMLEFVNVKDMPEEHKLKQLFVSYSKTQPDALFMGNSLLPISSESEEKVASFQCQPSGMLLFELVAWSPCTKEVLYTSETLGSCSISLEDLLLPESGFMIEKWLELTPSIDNERSKPISLRMSISVTPPTPAPLDDLINFSTSLCAKSCTASNCDHITINPSVNDCQASPCRPPSVNDCQASPCRPPSVNDCQASPCRPPSINDCKASPCRPPSVNDCKASPCRPPSVNDCKASPCRPPSVNGCQASPCRPPSVNGCQASPCRPPSVNGCQASPCRPPSVNGCQASPCRPPSVNDCQSSPCRPPSANVCQASPCRPPSVNGCQASPCRPPSVKQCQASPCRPPSVKECQASPCRPPSVKQCQASPCRPPSTKECQASPCRPPSVKQCQASPCRPPSTKEFQASPCRPPSVKQCQASPCRPPSTKECQASPCRPPSVKGCQASPCHPPSGSAGVDFKPSHCGPLSANACVIGSKVVPCGTPCIVGSKASPCDPPCIVGSKTRPCGPPFVSACVIGSKANSSSISCA